MFTRSRSRMLSSLAVDPSGLDCVSDVRSFCQNPLSRTCFADFADSADVWEKLNPAIAHKTTRAIAGAYHRTDRTRGLAAWVGRAIGLTQPSSPCPAVARGGAVAKMRGCHRNYWNVYRSHPCDVRMEAVDTRRRAITSSKTP
jgi:hypothetical protein